LTYIIFIGAALLLIVDLLLSVALIAAGALSQVALHRLSQERAQRLRFLDDMQKPSCVHRGSAVALRQLSLLGATFLLIIGANRTAWPHPVLLATVLAAILGVVLLEGLVARMFALWNPRLALRLTAGVVRGAHMLLYPVMHPLVSLGNKAAVNHQRSEEDREEEQEEEVEALIEVGEREGLLEAEEGEMMRGIVDLDEKIVREIMTPRTGIEALPTESTVSLARAKLLASGHSRLPVYHGSIDNVVGVLHARDLFHAWEKNQEGQTVAQYLRPAVFVPETLSAAELLSEIRQKTQLAMVVDEYGGTAGLVTLQDLLEEIVGDIRDEHDKEEELVRKEDDNSWLINAIAHVEELEEMFGIEFDERDFDTVGGLVVSSFGRVPLEGESLEAHGLLLEIVKADPRRVHMVRVRRVSSTEEDRQE
jgi:CBS domain containing-hemolysin-like protein